LNALGGEGEVVVVDPEFAHEEEGSAEEPFAFCRANVQYISNCCRLHSAGREASCISACVGLRTSGCAAERRLERLEPLQLHA
jgi:hypothetical protein